MINTKRSWLVLAGLAALSGAGCGRGASESYFPLEVGARWVYELRTEMPDPPVDAVLRLQVDREVRLDGRDVTVRRSDSGVEYYLEKTGVGIQRIASRVDLDEAAQLDQPARMVLPANPVVGAEWESVTVPYLLRRNAEFPRELKYRHQTMMRYRVEAIGETVEVPAGVFKDCLRVKGSTTFKLFKDPIQGFADQPLTTQEWYCKGVGLVLLEREEVATSSFLTGGKIRYQLTDYDL